MRRKYIQLLFGLLLAIPLLLVHCRPQASNVKELEWPPSLSAAVEQASTVPYCELVRNATRFNNVIVRTEAIFYKNLENSIFRDPRCSDNLTWVEFDPAYAYSSETLKNKFTELACLKQARCEGNAQITVVGRFEGPKETGYGHLGCCPTRFLIMRIEKVEPVAAWQR